MLRNKKGLSLFLSLILVLGVLFGAVPQQSFAEGEDSLLIVHTNDIHGRFNYSEKDGTIGFAKFKTKLDQLRAENPNLLLLDAGDTTHGTIDINLSSGESMIDIMNMMGYDAMATGNHDFNYGYDQLLELRERADFPILAANVVKERDNKSDFESRVLKDVNGIKVGIFGLATEETKYKSSPVNTEGIKFEDYMKTAREEVAALKKEGAQVIIALTHIGIDEATDITTEDIANEVDGIDLIVDGHSHTKLPEGKLVKNTLLAQTGSFLSNLGMVEIKLEDGKITKKSASLFSAEQAKDLALDPAVEAKLEEINEKNAEVKKQVIGKTKVELVGEREVVRKEESTLGNVITDAMLEASGADVALTNGGGIRASIAEGDITLGAALEAFPFTNFLSTIEVTGSDIVKALEYGVDKYPNPEGKFPHVAGMKYVFDPDQPAGDKIISVEIAGKKLDLNKTYKLVTNDFVAIGGDGYTMFEGKKIVAEGALLSDVLIEYLKDKGEINPSVEGRITTGKAPAEETDKGVIRLAGEGRVETAIEVSKKAFKDGGAATVVIAGYDGAADASIGTLLAEEKNAPLLITKKNDLGKVKAEIERLGATKVYIIGGEKVVMPSVEKQLKDMKLEVVRLAGATRVQTAVKVADEVFKDTKPAEAFIVSYHGLSDALAIGPVSAMKKAPVLITLKDKLPAETKTALNSMKVKDAIIVGGENVVSAAGKKAVEAATGKTAERVSGVNRIRTALEIAGRYFENPEAVVVASGYEPFADALVGGYFAAEKNAPIILSNVNTIVDEAVKYAADNGEVTYVLGGEKAISKNVFDKLRGITASEDEMTLTILGTTDIHGNIYNWSYENEKETNNSGMAKVHSVIKEVRKENPNTILVDAGDLIQGTILTDEVFTKDLTKVNPMADVFNFIGYDAMALGNHEFNFGLDVVNKFKKDTEFPVLSANIFNKADGSNFAEPYTIVERNGLKVGILGLTTPNIPRWDGSKVTSLSFKGMHEAADMYIDEMYEKGADIIVTVSHSGLDQEYQEGDDMRTVLKNHPDITAAIVGHTHASVKETVGTTIVGGARSTGTEVIKIDIDFKKKDGKWSEVDKRVDLIQVEDYEASQELKEYAKDYHEATLEFIKGEFGTATEDFQPKNEIKGIPEGYIRDTAVMDLINQIQLDDSGADVSAAALFSDSSDIKKGPVTYADIFGIYRFPNTLVMVEATGQELINYMEWSAKYFNTYKDGDVSISFNPNVRSYLYDMFAGVDYKIDLSKPAGERITDVIFKGKPLKMDDTLKLVVNDYRYSVLQNEKILSGDPIYESDPVSSRELIAKHIKELGTISPEVDNNWEIAGIDLNHTLRDYIIGEVNAGRIELPKSEDGRTSNVKALNVYELIKDGTIPASVLEEHGLDAEGNPK